MTAGVLSPFDPRIDIGALVATRRRGVRAGWLRPTARRSCVPESGTPSSWRSRAYSFLPIATSTTTIRAPITSSALSAP